MPQQREAHPQSTARVEELKTSETQLKELSYTEEQQPLISSYLAATVEQEMSWLTPEECVWTLENPPGHPPTLEWRIKTMGGKLIPEEELDDEDADDTPPLTDEQKLFISVNLPAVVAREAPWLTDKEIAWIRGRSTHEERTWAKFDPPGCPPLPEWRAKLMGKRLIAEEEVGDETTFKRSDLGDNYYVGSGYTKCIWVKRRLNVRLGRNNVAICINYG